MNKPLIAGRVGSNIVTTNSFNMYNKSLVFVWEYKGESKAPVKFEFPIDILKKDSWNSYQATALGVLIAFRDYSVNFFLNIKKKQSKSLRVQPESAEYWANIFLDSDVLEIVIDK